MGTTWSFWSDCAKRARKGTGAFANDWQWVVGVPAVSAIGVYVASDKGTTGVTTGYPIVDAFLAALAAFAITWLVAFMIRLFKTAPEIFVEQKQLFDSLQKRLEPTIKLVAIQVSPISGLHRLTRNFDLEVVNESARELDNCLVCVTDIRFEGDDIAATYRRHLPLSLVTVRNSERNGGGPFRLRAGQNKKVPFCTREDGKVRDLRILYEKEEPFFAHSLRDKRKIAVDIKIYGSESPTVATLSMVMNPADELEVFIDEVRQRKI